MIKDLGVMLDCSRNAVMRVSELKKFIDLLKEMGYTYVMLYTEDTYEVENQPYFGYMRGRYSVAELKEIDDYAYARGIELIPCIQTLAHLNIFRWNVYKDINDCNDILLCDNEKTYELIEDMLRTVSKTFRSNRVHVGMDEAHFLGLGKYLDKNGYQKRSDILLRHLEKVSHISEKYGLKPMIWSDMFFRLANHGEYHDSNITISDEVKNKVPKNVELVYWDYYHTEKKFYDGMLKTHLQFNNPISFAGGAWTWRGFTPNNKFSIASSKAAIKSCNDNGIDSAMVTLWGDNGKECSFYAVLPSLMCFAQFAKGNFDMKDIKAKFEKLIGISFDDFMKADLLDAGFSKGLNTNNPSKYLLYNDAFMGILDSTLSGGESSYYKKCSAKLKRLTDNERFGYVFESLYRLSRVLEIKSDLGARTRKAYTEKDLNSLKDLANGDYKRLLSRLKDFYCAFKTLWEKENKAFGFEVQDVRLGGLIQRTAHQRETLLAFVDGKINSIDELDEPLLDFCGNGDFSKEQIAFNNWVYSVSPNVI